MIRALKIAALFIPVVVGGFIYIIFRTERLIMFHWFEYVSLSHQINILKNLRTIYSFPSWFIYSLPDGLWTFSYVAVSLQIWKFSITCQNVFWIFSIPISAVLSEFLQLFRLIPGTFDPIDIIFYLLGASIPYYLSKNNLNIKRYEKP